MIPSLRPLHVQICSCALEHVHLHILRHGKQKVKGLNAAGHLDRLTLPTIWLTLSLAYLGVSFFLIIASTSSVQVQHDLCCCTSLPGLSCPATATNLCQPSLSSAMPKRTQQPLPVLPPTSQFLNPGAVFSCHLFLPLPEPRTVMPPLCATPDSCQPLAHLLALTRTLALSLTFREMSLYLIFLEVQPWLSSLYPFPACSPFLLLEFTMSNASHLMLPFVLIQRRAGSVDSQPGPDLPGCSCYRLSVFSPGLHHFFGQADSEASTLTAWSITKKVHRSG